jgi:tetratricopeptide (TPR) repeat protein
VRLDQARSQARRPLTLRDPQVAEARKDAEAAIAAGAAGEGSYALGRVFEDTNDPVMAEQHYRRALAANPAADRAGSRYRVALGRVLLKLNPLPGQQVPVPVPAPAQAPVPNRVGQLPASETELRTTLTLMLVGVVADDDETPELDEIIRLADQAIKARNYEGYLIKAGALARKGMWTEALRMYSEGLRYLIRPEYAEGLNALVNNHPAFNLPDPLRNPDPLRAERHYGAGLRAYFAGQYMLAEREFIEAYRNQGQDARILYYLGLSRLPQQGKRSAATVNFQMAAILEQQNKPSPAAVNASLERVQGELRRFLTTYRP